MSLDLETYTELIAFRFDGDELTPMMPQWYKCPECGGGPVTNYGGNLYICQDCEYQP